MTLAAAPAHGGPGMVLDLPPLDLPFNADGGLPLRDPSMQQSLALQADLTHALHFALGQLLRQGDRDAPPWYGRLAIAAVDVIAAVRFPLNTGGWLHEEWHRAVMTHRDVHSRNGFYDFDYDGPVPADQVSDEALGRFKREHPAEHVRMSAAGHEAHMVFLGRLERDRFFHRVRAWNRASMWFQVLAAGMALSAARDANEADYIEKFGDEPEWTDVSRRDFAGRDALAWVYDLHRPDEPYEMRGTHPSGIGIDRYRFVDDLTPQEKRYLDRTARLSFLNLVNPMLFGFDRFSWRDLQWNANLRHTLASFGNAIDLNLYLQTRTTGLVTTLHLQETPEKIFPGLSAELIGWQPGGWQWLALSPRLSLWQQPERQRFDSRRGVWGGMVQVEGAVALPHQLELYAVTGGKTDGWVAGEVQLEAGWFARSGLRWWLF